MTDEQPTKDLASTASKADPVASSSAALRVLAIEGDTEKARGETNRALAVIDWEITHAQSIATRPGWTPWLLLAALAAVGWALLAQGNLLQIDAKRTLLAYAAVAAAFETVRAIRRLLLPARALSVGGAPRFGFSSETLGKSRIGFAFSAVEGGLLAWAFLSYRDVLHGLALVAVAKHVFAAALATTALVMSILRLPVAVGPSNSKAGRAILLLMTAAAAVTGFVAVAWLTEDARTNPALALGALKVGALLVAAFWLVVELAREPESIALNERLVRLRRDLAHERISARDALTQADLAVEGLRLADVFQDDVAGLLKQADEFAQVSHSIEVNLAACAKLIRAPEYGSDETVQAAYAACFAKATSLIPGQGAKVDAIHASTKKFGLRLAFASGSNEAQKADARALLERMMTDVAGEMSRATGEVQKQVAALQAAVTERESTLERKPITVTVVASAEKVETKRPAEPPKPEPEPEREQK